MNGLSSKMPISLVPRRQGDLSERRTLRQVRNRLRFAAGRVAARHPVLIRPTLRAGGYAEPVEIATLDVDDHGVGIAEITGIQTQLLLDLADVASRRLDQIVEPARRDREGVGRTKGPALGVGAARRETHSAVVPL